jgi:hypothetical protein
MGAVLAFFQKNPKTKPIIKSILELGSDGRVMALTAKGTRPYKASLVTPEGYPITAYSEEFLKELARQAKLSQITYEYTEDIDKIEEYRALLQQGNI